MKKIAKIEILVICYCILLSGCFVIYVSPQGLNKVRSQQSERQQKAQRYIYRQLSLSFEARSAEYRQRCGTLLKETEIIIYTAGSHLGKNLVIEIVIYFLDSSSLKPVTIDKEWRECPLPGSKELDQAIDEIINEVMKHITDKKCGKTI